LFLLNGAQVRRWAKGFAERLVAESKSESPGDRTALIRRAYALALSRPPTPEEVRDATSFLESQTASYRAEGNLEAAALALADFCQVLFGLNEFAYEN
jgi:hypothetical protein